MNSAAEAPQLAHVINSLEPLVTLPYPVLFFFLFPKANTLIISGA